MIGENTHKRGLKQSIDWKLITVYILLVLIGWVNIYASIHSENPTSIIDWNFRSGKQFVWMLTSFGLAGFIQSLLSFVSLFFDAGFIFFNVLGAFALIVFDVFGFILRSRGGGSIGFHTGRLGFGSCAGYGVNILRTARGTGTGFRF